ncbi:phosphate uptake regulator PhoU [Candidatus Woesearchaeota archaeon]|nr:phosphate uptake regulator PhoU [Candidatus Woesearchaeota archaeon]
MEYRKLISFGKSSYVVSLPKSWVKLSKLKKGDLVYIEENEGNLLLQPRANEEGDKEKEIIINVDGKDLRRIQRETISAYLQNNKTIILAGNEIKEKAKEIQNFIQNLIALEIIEQDSKRIVAKDFLNINDISIEQIIRKMDVIVRSMLKDCKEMFKEDSYENLYLRDNDVNKFRFLIYRIIWFGIENPSQIFKKLNIKQKDLFINWWLAFSIESIADYVKRIARDMKKIKLSKRTGRISKYTK